MAFSLRRARSKSVLEKRTVIHNGQPHDYVPDFLVRLKTDPEIVLILETKGFDELADITAAAAERW